MIYVTGDTHRIFSRVDHFCKKFHTTKEDIMVILGDAGINYTGKSDDDELKRYLYKLPITLFCIHGNHEMRPWNARDPISYEFHGGKVFGQAEYPDLHFAVDGEVFELGGLKCLVCGGAYSVDRDFRLATGRRWFADEQPDLSIKFDVMRSVQDQKKFDVILSHTCPAKFTPVEAFLPGLDQSRVDRSTEEFLDEVESTAEYDHWYCGHWHIDKRVNNFRFVFQDILILGE